MNNDLSVLEPQRYPTLAGDIETAYGVLAPRLSRARARALGHRKARTRFRWGLILGCAVAAALGFAAVVSSASTFLVAEAVLAAVLAVAAYTWRRAESESRWIRHAHCVEQLLGEGFRCVGRLGPYKSSPRPADTLAERADRVLRLAEGSNTDG